MNLAQGHHPPNLTSVGAVKPNACHLVAQRYHDWTDRQEACSMKAIFLVRWSAAAMTLGASVAMSQGVVPLISEAQIVSRPASEDYYPPASKAVGEAGLVRVTACYGTNGRVTSAELAESSGSNRLDEAAIKLARQVRIRPGTRDGVPAAGCVVVPVRFELPPTTV